MEAQELIAQIEAAGGIFSLDGESIAYEVPSQVKPLLAELRQQKADALRFLREREYKARAERALQVICRHGASGLVPWLANHSPLLYDLLTCRLPDTISNLWNERAPLEDFDRVLNDWLGVYFLADSEYRTAQGNGDHHE